MDQHLRPQFVALRKSLKSKGEELELLCTPYVDKDVFPPLFISKFKELKMDGCLNDAAGFGSIGANFLEGCVLCFELGKCDANFSTFCGVHWALATEAIA